MTESRDILIAPDDLPLPVTPRYRLDTAATLLGISEQYLWRLLYLYGDVLDEPYYRRDGSHPRRRRWLSADDVRRLSAVLYRIPARKPRRAVNVDPVRWLKARQRALDAVPLPR